MSDHPPSDLKSTLARISDEELREKFRVFFAFRERNPPETGMVDIICLGRDPDYRALTAFALGNVLLGAGDQFPFKTLHIVFHREDAASETTRAHAARLMLDLFPGLTAQGIQKFLDSALQFYGTASCETEELVNYLKSLPPNATVIVHNASAYRDGAYIEESVEDEWVLQVKRLSQSISASADQQHLYVQILTGRLAPSLNANIDSLMALPGAFWGAIGASAKASGRAESLREWVSASESGQVEYALSEIDKSQLSSPEQTIARALCLGAAQMFAQAFEQIKPLMAQLIHAESAENLTVLARLATNAKEQEAAKVLLREALKRSAPSLTVLSRIYQLSWRVNDQQALTEVQEKILSLYPKSGLKALIEARLREGDLHGLGELVRTRFPSVDSTPEWALYGSLISDAFSTSSPNVRDAINAIASRFPARADQAVLDSVRFALGHLTPASESKAESIEEISIVGDEREIVSDEREEDLKLGKYSVALDALEARELHPDSWPLGAELAIEILSGVLSSVNRLRDNSLALTLMRRAFDYAVRYLARNPKDQSRRVRLSRVLSTDAAGSNGLVVLLWATMSTPVSVYLSPVPKEHAEVASTDVFMQFSEEYWAKKKTTANGGFPLVIEPLEGIDLPASPSALLNAGMFNLEHMAWRFVGGELDVQALHMLLKVCIDLSSVSPGAASPAEVLRAVADGLADGGAFQEARDLAEQAFFLSGAEPTDRDMWFAWITYSDVYHRLGNPHEALLGWLCAYVHSNITATPTEVFPTIALIARIFRDLGLYKDALEQTARARELLSAANLLEGHGYRVDELEASIEFKRLMQSRDAAEEEWEHLTEKLTASVHRALERVDNAAVPASLLAQVIRRFQLENRPIPAATGEVFANALELLGEPQASRLRALASPSPNLDSVRHFSWGLAKVRYARDLGEDFRKLSLIAKRTLGGAVHANNPIPALLAIELLADHTVGLSASLSAPVQVGPQSESNAAVELLENPATLIGFAAGLSKGEIGIHALGQSEDGSLIHVAMSGGELLGPIQEPPDVFSQQTLARWRQEYPIQYPHDPDRISDINALEQRMRGIGMSGPVRGREVVLMRENTLSDIPANLLLCEGRLLGTMFPVSTVPSLSWLKADMNQQAKLPSRQVAWLLPTDESGSSPLSLLYQDLQRVLPRHSIDVIQGASPGNISGSGLVVLAGHGSVWGRERYFKQLSGEDISSFTGMDVANAVRGSGIVVLLVCSAGRLDRDLFSSRSVGLPHQLLRQGCRVVVASPWPIKFALAGQWLNWFLEALRAGMTVSESTYYANCELRDRYWRVSDFLAMHVIGNPFLRLDSSDDSQMA